mmetsp:Transcript_12396/g.30444  ORF Transcript_12396/g.30444 Transcript_12396/m.30444 type:complete len:225 (-) Transcript_12396:529-1203(-)
MAVGADAPSAPCGGCRLSAWYSWARLRLCILAISSTSMQPLGSSAVPEVAIPEEAEVPLGPAAPSACPLPLPDVAPAPLLGGAPPLSPTPSAGCPAMLCMMCWPGFRYSCIKLLSLSWPAAMSVDAGSAALTGAGCTLLAAARLADPAATRASSNNVPARGEGRENALLPAPAAASMPGGLAPAGAAAVAGGSTRPGAAAGVLIACPGDASVGIAMGAEAGPAG